MVSYTVIYNHYSIKMALNPNHGFEDLGEFKCAIVEKNCSPARAEFLKKLLEFNKFTVVTVPSPAPKTATKPAVAAVASAEGVPVTETPPVEQAKVPETFTVGVTDLSFNTVNAIYNRLLKMPDGKIVLPEYWKQEVKVDDESWYWKHKN